MVFRDLHGKILLGLNEKAIENRLGQVIFPLEMNLIPNQVIKRKKKKRRKTIMATRSSQRGRDSLRQTLGSA